MRNELLIFASALALVSVNQASAAMIAEWRYGSVPSGYVGPVEAYDYAAGVTPSDFDGHGSVGIIEQFVYRGWPTTIDLNNYCGFTVQAEPGNALTITDFKFSSVVGGSNVSAFQWGYRVNDGSGFGAWTLGELYETGDTGFNFVSSSLNEKIWDIADFTTTGTVEFGLFAQSPDTTSTLIVSQPRPLVLNGSVAAVPEPSAALLSVAGALVAFRRRR